jgi:hypothetical protein
MDCAHIKNINKIKYLRYNTTDTPPKLRFSQNTARQMPGFSDVRQRTEFATQGRIINISRTGQPE